MVTAHDVFLCTESRNPTDPLDNLLRKHRRVHVRRLQLAQNETVPSGSIVRLQHQLTAKRRILT